MTLPLRIAISLFAVFYASKGYSILEVDGIEIEKLEGGGVVSVIYDIENTDGRPILVFLEYTTDGEFWSEAIEVSGDVGESVTQGYDRRILWNARAELPDQLFPAMQVRVRAIDGFDWGPLSF